MSLLAPPPIGINETLRDSALGAEGRDVRNSVADALAPPRPRGEEMLTRISKALERGRLTQGLLVCPETFGHAIDLLFSLPDEIPAPDVVVESESEIGLDWDRGARRVLSVTVGKRHLSWAALVGHDPSHGTADEPNRLPSVVRHLLRTIYSFD